MTSDLRNWSHDFFTEFIELYQSFPCLWQVKSKDYSNRDKKNQAYAALLNKYREIDSDATKDSITKKINSFRTVYRKECAKIKASKRSGAGAEEIYKHSLWYFHLLSFLNDKGQQSRKSRTNIEGSEKEEEDEEELLDEEHSQTGSVFSPLPTPRGGRTETVKETVSSCDTLSSSSRSSFTRKRNRSKNSNDPTTEVLQLAGEKLKAVRSDDEFDAYGKYVAHKLRDLKGNQYIFARKLINDVIFEAELEALSKDFKIVNCAGTSRGQFLMPQIVPYDHYKNVSQANLLNSTMGHPQPTHQVQLMTNSDNNTNIENSSSLPGISAFFANFEDNA